MTTTGEKTEGEKGKIGKEGKGKDNRIHTCMSGTHTLLHVNMCS